MAPKTLLFCIKYADDEAHSLYEHLQITQIKVRITAFISNSEQVIFKLYQKIKPKPNNGEFRLSKTTAQFC